MAWEIKNGRPVRVGTEYVTVTADRNTTVVRRGQTREVEATPLIMKLIANGTLIEAPPIGSPPRQRRVGRPGTISVLNYSRGADTGGQGWRLYKAFNKHTDLVYHQSVASGNYIQYPRHLNSRRVNPSSYDVVHDNNKIRPSPNRPTVIHYHGSTFRNNPEPYLTLQRKVGAVGLGATLDLVLLSPDELIWCPAPYDLDWLMSYRRPVDDGVFRVGHAPTDRVVKSTLALDAAVKRLNKETPTQLVMSERKTWEETLVRKGTVDVYFDQVLLGYGNNSIEAWGMGIPVICGGPPETLAEMRRRFGELPFYEATEDTIYEALRAMADPETRELWGKRGQEHAKRFHADIAVVELLTPIYKGLAA